MRRIGDVARQMAEWRERNNLLDSYDEGKKKGLEEGTQIGTTLGTVNLLSLQIKQKFAIDAKEWLSTLSLSQLSEVANELAKLRAILGKNFFKL